MLATTTYFIYLTISIVLSVWVAKTLFRNGRVFLLETFNENAEMADSVNRLLVVGFCLLNFGFVALFLSFGEEPATVIEMIQYISTKIGVVLMVLGMAHFINIYNFAKMRRKSRRKASVKTEAARPVRLVMSE